MKDQITLRDIYSAVDSLENKIDQKFEKFEERIHSLETDRDKALGWMAGIGIIVSTGVSIIWKKLFGD